MQRSADGIQFATGGSSSPAAAHGSNGMVLPFRLGGGGGSMDPNAIAYGSSGTPISGPFGGGGGGAAYATPQPKGIKASIQAPPGTKGFSVEPSDGYVIVCFLDEDGAEIARMSVGS